MERKLFHGKSFDNKSRSSVDFADSEMSGMEDDAFPINRYANKLPSELRQI